ncbi:hypothetical protein BBR01nite_10160 [Brevibacillus brevis]|nr:hypothetical protein BBR01nite_10160 [Brevibacillus brevis]
MWLSVVIFSFLIMLGVLASKLNGGLEKKVKIPYQYMLVFLILTFVWIGLCWVAGYPQLAAIPPILVVVYESFHKPMFNGKMAFKLGLVLTISATVGTLLYFAIDSWVIVMLPVSALIASTFFFGSVLIYKKWERKRSQLHAPRK